VIDDDLLDEFVVTGTFDQLPALLVERYGGLATRLVLYFAGLAWRQEAQGLRRWGEIVTEVHRHSPEPTSKERETPARPPNTAQNLPSWRRFSRSSAWRTSLRRVRQSTSSWHKHPSAKSATNRTST